MKDAVLGSKFLENLKGTVVVLTSKCLDWPQVTHGWLSCCFSWLRFVVVVACPFSALLFSIHSVGPTEQTKNSTNIESVNSARVDRMTLHRPQWREPEPEEDTSLFRGCPSTVSCAVQTPWKCQFAVDSHLGTRLTRQAPQSSSKGNLFVQVPFGVVLITAEAIVQVQFSCLLSWTTNTGNAGRTVLGHRLKSTSR